jgi:hypothetical protein
VRFFAAHLFGVTGCGKQIDRRLAGSFFLCACWRFRGRGYGFWTIYYGCIHILFLLKDG